MIARSQIRVTHGVRVTSLSVTKSTNRSVVSPKSFNSHLINGVLGNSMTRAMTTTKLHDHLHNKELAPANIKNVERTVNTIIRLYGITSPNTANAIKLKAMLKEKGRAPNTIRIYLWAMKYWAQSQKRDIDFDECPTPRIEETPIEIVPFPIIRKILDNPNFTERNRAIIAMFVYSGCRVRELTELKVDDLKLAEGVVTYRRTKGKMKFRDVPLAPECIEIMKSYMEIRNGHLASLDKECSYVFITGQGGPMSTDLVRQTMGRMKKEIGGDIKKFHPHLLRHTSLTKLANTKDINIREVQQIAGHSSVTITERYTHVQFDQLQAKVTKNLAYD
jgi:integrase/recombinase XerC